ncbi:MAG TPA: hypothetical protein VFU69_14950 [Ktedonobacterales bacterium]|nr:hypothetical protein [Ktedonobacterales bacterium]
MLGHRFRFLNASNYPASPLDSFEMPYGSSKLHETHRVEYIEAEDEAFDAELAQHGLSWQPGSHIPDLAYHARILKSWERILNIDEVDPNRYWTKPTKAEKDIQGTFWSLSLNQVRKATPFIGHGKPLTPLLL